MCVQELGQSAGCAAFDRATRVRGVAILVLKASESVGSGAQGGGEVVAHRARRGLLITAGAVVVGAVVQVVTNYATSLAPGWLRDPWHVWSVLVVLVLVLVIFDLITERSRAEPESIQPVALPPSVRLAVAPSSLRPPYVEPGTLRGRDGELARLAELVEEVPAQGMGGLVVVAGPGGIGKTTLVAVAAADAATAGRVVFWMRWRAGDTAESLTARMVDAATTLGLPAQRMGAAQVAGASLVDVVWAHLEATPGWVVVLDNLDQPATVSGDGEPVADYRGWIRPSRAGLVVVSSRDQDSATWGPAAQLIRLGPLDEHAGGQVLLTAAPKAGTAEQAQGLSVRLGGFPLALRAAGRALAEPTAALRSFGTYQRALASRSISLLPDLPASPDASDPEIARRLVGYTWELSLDQLAGEGLPLARPLLRLIALFAEAPIPRFLFAPDLLSELTGSDVSAAALDGALAGLGRYGLLEVPDPVRTYQIPTLAVHPLVRETTLLLLKQTTDPLPWYEALSRWLITQVDDTAAVGRDGWDTARLLAPHLPLLTGLHSADPDTFRPARDALDTLATQLRAAGAFAAELGLRQTVLHAEERVLGAEHPHTLASRNNLALALNDRGEPRRAAELHQQTLILMERVRGAEHPDTLNSRNNLALALTGWGSTGGPVSCTSRSLPSASGSKVSSTPIPCPAATTSPPRSTGWGSTGGPVSCTSRSLPSASGSKVSSTPIPCPAATTSPSRSTGWGSTGGPLSCTSRSLPSASGSKVSSTPIPCPAATTSPPRSTGWGSTGGPLSCTSRSLPSASGSKVSSTPTP